MYKIDPARRRREKIHNALNQGHRFALCDKKSGKIIEASREKRQLEFTMRFRSDLVFVDLNEELAKLMAE